MAQRSPLLDTGEGREEVVRALFEAGADRFLGRYSGGRVATYIRRFDEDTKEEVSLVEKHLELALTAQLPDE